MTPQRPETTERILNCMDHSGMTARMNIGIGLLLAQLGLFGYSAFVQLPKFEDRMIAQFNSLEKRVDKNENDISCLQREDQKIMTQRNFDHPQKDPMR